VLAVVHGLYYVVTGLWPWVHLDSFLRLTGPKSDVWLVQTVGLLVALLGVSFLVTHRRTAGGVVPVFGSMTASAFVAVDVYFYTQSAIGAVYLLDAVAELLLGLGWVWMLLHERFARSQ